MKSVVFQSLNGLTPSRRDLGCPVKHIFICSQFLQISLVLRLGKIWLASEKLPNNLNKNIFYAFFNVGVSQ